MWIYRVISQWWKRRKWASLQSMTRLEALRLLIANGQPVVPPSTSYRGDVISIADAGAREHRRDPPRHGGDVRGDVA
jgi:hypothetical protein